MVSWPTTLFDPRCKHEPERTEARKEKNSCDAPFGVLLVIYMFGFWCSKDSKFELFGDEALFHPNG